MTNKVLIALGLIVIALIVYFVYNTFTSPVALPGDGIPIDVAQDPIQISDTCSTVPPIQIGSNRYFFEVKAKYTIKGMLVSKRRYSRGFWSKISPYDYALVWGKIPEYMQFLTFDQTYRLCLFKYRFDSPIDKDYIETHMSNNHLIPANVNIRRALKKFKKGENIELEGYLVYIIGRHKTKGSVNWNSSLTRLDKGNGACEVFYVTKIRSSDVIYE
jgi:hypothetical protein